MSYITESARWNVAEHLNLPEYTGPGLPARARNAVKELTEVPDHALDEHKLDENVLASLPHGCHITDLQRSGAAYWTRAMAIKTTGQDGNSLNFFLKVSQPSWLSQRG